MYRSKTLTVILAIVALAATAVTEDSAHVVQSNQGKIEELQAQIDYLNGLVNVAEANGMQLRSAAPKRGRSLVEEEEHEQSQFQKHIDLYTAMTVITAIIGISIGFEITKDVLEEATRESMKPILRNIFGELTILGFIGLVMFLVTKYGKPALDHMAAKWFPEECPDNDCAENPLIELTETVHMVLFMVMMIFLGSAVLMVKIGNRKKKRWRYLEDYSLVTPMPVIKIKTHEAEVNAQKNMLCSRLGAKMTKPTIFMKDCDTQLYALGLFIRRTKTSTTTPKTKTTKSRWISTLPSTWTTSSPKCSLTSLTLRQRIGFLFGSSS